MHEKTGANLHIFQKMRKYLQDIQDHSTYLHKYWFNLKISDRQGMKSPYHNMVGNGPCTLQLNCTLLPHFSDIILLQICDIYYLVSTKYILKIQDMTTMIGVCANIALEKFLNFNKEFFGHFSNGKPVCLTWL